MPTLAERLSSQMMLNEGFTLATFERELKARPFKVVHIASHGVFGSTAEESYALAYDAKLDMNRLESLFKLNYTHAEPVELLMLSACSSWPATTGRRWGWRG